MFIAALFTIARSWKQPREREREGERERERVEVAQDTVTMENSMEVP